MLRRYILFFSLLLLTTLGISPSAGFSGFMPTTPNIVYGSAGKTIAGAGQLGKKVAKNAGNIVKKKTKLKNNATKRLAGLSQSQMKTVLQSAQAAKKGSTVAGHALSKHAGRNPKIWGKVTGASKTWHNQAMKHFREIIRGPGDFKRVTSKGRDFLEKRLYDGRGVRLNLDHTFKTFID